MDIDEFLSNDKLPRDWIQEPGFSGLYVRKGPRYTFVRPPRLTYALDLANVSVENPGKGTFTRLLDRLENERPDLSIYVESIQVPRLADFLRRRGYIDNPHVLSLCPCLMLVRNYLGDTKKYGRRAWQRSQSAAGADRLGLTAPAEE